MTDTDNGWRGKTETRIDDLVSVLETVIARPARRLAAADQAGGAARMCADIRAARAALDWSPRTDLANGLARLVQDLRTAPVAARA